MSRRDTGIAQHKCSMSFMRAIHDVVVIFSFLIVASLSFLLSHYLLVVSIHDITHVLIY
jgi:hypothetical protein